jgi:hypothetical protein
MWERKNLLRDPRRPAHRPVQRRLVVATRMGVPTTPGNLQGGIAGPTLSFDGGYAEASYSFGGRRL